MDNYCINVSEILYLGLFLMIVGGVLSSVWIFWSDLSFIALSIVETMYIRIKEGLTIRKRLTLLRR